MIPDIEARGASRDSGSCCALLARNWFNATSDQPKTEFIGRRNDREKVNEFKGLCCGRDAQT
jgi:hypothetical protein